MYHAVDSLESEPVMISRGGRGFEFAQKFSNLQLSQRRSKEKPRQSKNAFGWQSCIPLCVSSMATRSCVTRGIPPSFMRVNDFLCSRKSTRSLAPKANVKLCLQRMAQRDITFVSTCADGLPAERKLCAPIAYLGIWIGKRKSLRALSHRILRHP